MSDRSGIAGWLLSSSVDVVEVVIPSVKFDIVHLC
nr:MAG TPA: hypothetical protein [Caudoviricetes sp.]